MEIVNRVAQSDIQTLDLASLWDDRPVVEFDIAPFLHRGIVLREKDFRQHVKDTDWSEYAGKHVAVHCSADAIVPTWAYMLITSKLDGIAASVALGREADLRRESFARALEDYDWSQHAGKPVVVKGCSNEVVPESAFVAATQRLQQVASKVMYGEACSAVAIWRKKKETPSKKTAAKKTVGVALPKAPGI